MEKFELLSKGSFIGLSIKAVVSIILVNQAFNLFEKLNGKMPLINLFLILGTLTYLVYRHLSDRTIVEIENGKLDIKTIGGLPKKHEKLSFDLKEISKIKLIQTHTQVYGKKMMELIDSNGVKKSVEINLRYYQMVKLQDYLNEKIKIETSLTG